MLHIVGWQTLMFINSIVRLGCLEFDLSQQVSLLVFRSVEDMPGIGDARYGKPSRSDRETSYKLISHRVMRVVTTNYLVTEVGIRNSPPKLSPDLRRSGTTLVQDPTSTIGEERPLFMHDLA